MGNIVPLRNKNFLSMGNKNGKHGEAEGRTVFGEAEGRTVSEIAGARAQPELCNVIRLSHSKSQFNLSDVFQNSWPTNVYCSQRWSEAN